MKINFEDMDGKGAKNVLDFLLKGEVEIKEIDLDNIKIIAEMNKISNMLNIKSFESVNNNKKNIIYDLSFSEILRARLKDNLNVLYQDVDKRKKIIEYDKKIYENFKLSTKKIQNNKENIIKEIIKEICSTYIRIMENKNTKTDINKIVEKIKELIDTGIIIVGEDVYIESSQVLIIKSFFDMDLITHDQLVIILELPEKFGSIDLISNIRDYRELQKKLKDETPNITSRNDSKRMIEFNIQNRVSCDFNDDKINIEQDKKVNKLILAYNASQIVNAMKNHINHSIEHGDRDFAELFCSVRETVKKVACQSDQISEVSAFEIIDRAVDFLINNRSYVSREIVWMRDFSREKIIDDFIMNI